jgi:LacI family transcriptional regulator
MTIAEVARAAGVSTATVSRVLNDDPAVGESYRRRVLKAVEETGYRPNRLARNLRKRHTGAIGIVVPDIENPHFSEAVRAVEDLAHSRGHHVLVCNTDETADKQATYLEALAEERVMGVIVSPSDPAGAEITRLIDDGITVVAMDREVADPRADAVIADNVRATRLATEHLLGLGHERIAYVGGRPNVETGAERLDGFQLSMRAARLDDTLVADGGFRIDGAHAAVGALLAAEGPRPTALVVGNNLMTIGALRAIDDAGLSVPGDVALVAIDDPFWARHIAPALTTVAQPVRRMATDAMELLLERVHGDRTSPRRIVHPVELRVRASCGTP